MLLVVSALLVAAAVAAASTLIVSAGAVVAVLLGVAATKITHSELMATRTEAARDRATQAKAYAALTERRTAENLSFALDMRRKIDQRQETIAGLEAALDDAQRQVLNATRKLNAEARRADLAENAADDAAREAGELIRGLEGSLSASEQRAAEAIVLVAELEAELDVLSAELASWRSAPTTRANSA